MVRVRRSSVWASDSWTSFAPDTTGERYQLLFDEYAYLTRNNPGWDLSTIRDMTSRERKYWFDMSIVRKLERE